jgi:hypothetical protein
MYNQKVKTAETLGIISPNVFILHIVTKLRDLPETTKVINVIGPQLESTAYELRI